MFKHFLPKCSVFSARDIHCLNANNSSANNEALSAFVGVELAKEGRNSIYCDCEGDFANYALMMSDLRISRPRTQVQGSDHEVTRRVGCESGVLVRWRVSWQNKHVLFTSSTHKLIVAQSGKRVCVQRATSCLKRSEVGATAEALDGRRALVLLFATCVKDS